LGEPHHGFFYPDPLGFWAEVRRWIAILVRSADPGLSATDGASVAALVHSGEDPSRVGWLIERCRPVVVLFLDEASRVAAGVEVGPDAHHIPDPHRPGTSYDGWWSAAPDGSVVGKSPQHPASHNFYRASDMDEFLRAAPLSPHD
jgi:hypothetical protein